MMRILMLLILMAFSSMAQALAGTSASLPYAGGNYGIGTTAPQALFQVGAGPSITAGSNPTAIIAGSFMVDGNIYASSGNKFYGDGSQLTGIASSATEYTLAPGAAGAGSSPASPYTIFTNNEDILYLDGTDMAGPVFLVLDGNHADAKNVRIVNKTGLADDVYVALHNTSVAYGSGDISDVFTGEASGFQFNNQVGKYADFSFYVLPGGNAFVLENSGLSYHGLGNYDLRGGRTDKQGYDEIYALSAEQYNILTMGNNFGSINLPLTADNATGIIFKNNVPFLHDFVGSGGTYTNVFVGQSAGNFTMDSGAANNTAVGYQSLMSLTSGSNNTAFGYMSLNKTADGSSNTAIGYRAMLNNESGESNSAFGRDALKGNISGGTNVAFGNSALLNLIDGSENVAVGMDALNGNISGSGNAVIGFNAGYLSVGTANVFIGYKAGYNELGDNKLYIANSDTSTPLIYGDFATGRVGIGVNGPVTALEVAASTSNSSLKIGTLEFQSYGLNNAWLGDNVYLDGADFQRRADGAAGLFYFVGNEGQFRFYANGSGSLGSGVGSVVQLKMNADGSVALGGGIDNNAGNYSGAALLANSSGVQIKKSFAVYRTAAAGDVSPTAGQTIIGVTDTTAPRTITLATADCVAGRIMIIKDESGAAGTNNITVNTQGGENIDGAASIAISANHGVLRVYSNGSTWFTF